MYLKKDAQKGKKTFIGTLKTKKNVLTLFFLSSASLQTKFSQYFRPQRTNTLLILK